MRARAQPEKNASPPQARGRAGYPLAWLLMIYGVAIGLRVWRFFSAELSGDNATTGLMGLAVLRGEFPYFFFGQNWMGGLDAILAAPLYALFGPSALTVNILSPLFSLLIMVCLQPLLRRTLGVQGMLAGLAYLAVPPTTWLFWSGEAQVHYLLGLLLSALLLFLTFQLWRAPAWPWPRLLLWGVVAGAALWINFSCAVVMLPCALFLLLTGGRRIRLWTIPLAAAGGVIGGAPLIWFNLTHGLVHGKQAGLFDSRYMLPDLAAMAQNALPLILGVNTAAVGGPPAWNLGHGALYGLLLLLVAAGIYFFCRAARGSWLPFACLLLGLLGFNILIVISTAYGKTLFSPDQRYMLSLYLVLPFLVGAAIQGLGKGRAWLAGLLMLALALAHVSQYPSFERWGQALLYPKAGFYLTREAHFKKQLNEMRAAGFHQVYVHYDPYPLAFLGNGDPEVSDYWRNRWFTASLRVDAALNPGLRDMAPGSLELLGLEHRNWRGKIAHDFTPPSGTEALLPRSPWRAQTRGRDLGRALSDGDLSTGFVTQGKAREGDSLTLDLGQSRPLGGLALVPADFRQVPRGLRVELAGPDRQYHTIHQARQYWGPFYWSGPHPFLKARNPRVETYFTPQEARYIRLTHLGQSNHPWSVQEVLAFGPGQQGQAVSWEQSAARVCAVLRRNEVTRVYGDSWIAAKVKLRFGDDVRVVTGNAAIDNYGTTLPPLCEPLLLDLRPGSALVVAQREAAQVGQRLSAWGVQYKARPAGRLVVLLPQGRVLGPAVTARRLTGRQAGTGLVWQVEGGQARLGWLGLDNPAWHKHPTPPLAVEVSPDGRAWRAAPLIKAGPLAFSGQVVFTASGANSLYRFTPPMSTRYVRVRSLGSREGNVLDKGKLTLYSP